MRSLAAAAPGDRGTLNLLSGAMGNQAVLRALGRVGAQREEREAEAVAESVRPGHGPRGHHTNSVAGTDSVGSTDRRVLELATGIDMDRVRIHRNAQANRAAAALGALAFTHGNDISFARHAPPLGSAAGLWLLAHEMTHAAQQDGDTPRVRLQHDPLRTFRNPNAGVMSDVPGAIPGDAMDPISGINVDETVRVTAPVLNARRRRSDRDQTYHLHSAIINRVPISAYAIPRTRLTLDADGTQPAAATVSTTPPEIAPGSRVYGPRRLPHVVLGTDAANVIVESTTTVHYAVGAGSCVLVRTNGGWYLFDAGINITESNALAEAIVSKIEARIGGEPLRAVFLTHAHYDHVSLLSRLSRRIQIDAIVANPLQFTRESYVAVRNAIRAADLLRRADVRARLEGDTAARQAFVDRLQRRGSTAPLHPEDIQREWRQEVARRVEAMYPELTESVSLPMRGASGPEFDTIDTRPLHGGERTGSVAVEDLLPSREGTQLRAVVDPDLPGRQTMRESEVDRMSTTYVLTIDGNRRIIMPDLRRTDVNRIARDLRAALAGQRVELQEWVSGHHMQVGWQEGVVSARTMRRTLELLHDFRARGRGGQPGRDVVIASVDPAQVDAAQIRLLRLLGFETYLAQSQTDVATYEVWSGGRTVRGVRGRLAPGSRGEPTLRRSIVGRRGLAAQIASLRARRPHTRGEDRRNLDTEVRALRQRLAHINSLELDLIAAARARPFDADSFGRAEAALNQELDAAGLGRVVTSSSQLTDTAMVLLRQPLGPEPAPGTPEAEQRARDVALRRQKTRVDLLRERARSAGAGQRQAAYAELYAELVQYQHMLEAAATRAGPGVVRTLTEAELTGIRAERVSLEGSFQSGEAVRLPGGELVETRVTRVRAPEATGRPHGPSRLARGMMRGLGIAGHGIGAVMVVTTITGSRDMIDRYEQGQANLAQLGIGGARAALSGYVGLRMIRGARVGVGMFIIIAALDVGIAVAGDYDSESERRQAIDESIRDAAIVAGCLVVGELLIATANPIGIAAGAVIMFLGPTIIHLLFDDPEPETVYPESVTNVDEQLTRLLNEYRIVAGGLALARRTPGEREDIGLRTNIQSDADRSVLRHRVRALILEQRILSRFQVAYREAARGRAGLRELDQMRASFLAMRARASTDTTDEEARVWVNRTYFSEGHLPIEVEYDEHGDPIPIRVITYRFFREMDRELSQEMTPQQVHDMDQWRSIRDEAVQLSMQVLRYQPVDPNWRQIAERQRGLETRLANARYRLDPAAQTAPGREPTRRQPLLRPGTPARAAYEEELARAERFVRATQSLILRSHWVNFRLEGVETPNIEGISHAGRHLSPQARRIAIVDDALDVYQRTIERIGGPPEAVGGVRALYSDPSARTIYLAQLRSNRTYRKLLQRLEVNDIAARSLLGSLERELDTGTDHGQQEPDASSPRGRLNALRRRFRMLQNDRKVRRGILFAREVEELGQRERRRATAYFTARLAAGRRREQPLRPDEIAALRSGDYGAVGRRLLEQHRTIAARLALIPNLRAPSGPTQVTDAQGTTMRVSRSLGGVMRLDGLRSRDVLLVGVTAASAPRGMVTVVPLNDAASTALGGGYAPRPVQRTRLTPATEDDLSQ